MNTIHLTPMALAYSKAGRDLFTFTESDTNTKRSIYIRNIAENWYKIGMDDPYLEFMIANAKKGDAYKIRFELLNVGTTPCTVAFRNKSSQLEHTSLKTYEPNVFEKKEHIIYCNDDYSEFIFNLRSFEKGSIVKNVELCKIEGAANFKVDTHIFKKQSLVGAFKKANVYDNLLQSGKYFRNSTSISNNHVVFTNNELVANIPSSEVNFTDCIAGAYLPSTMNDSTCVANIYIEYKSTVAIFVRGWNSGTTEEFGSFPASSTKRTALMSFPIKLKTDTDKLLFLSTYSVNSARSYTISSVRIEIVHTDGDNSANSFSVIV